MTKYIDVNCDLAWKVIGYSIWGIFSAVAILGIISTGTTLGTYSDMGDKTDWCHIDFWNGEKLCMGDWDFELKSIIQMGFNMSIVFLIAIQATALFILNMLNEWIALRCK